MDLFQNICTFLICQIKGIIPLKLLNMHFFLKIKEVFTVILAKSLNFGLF